jgi:very-short-patch-repair endonuclease
LNRLFETVHPPGRYPYTSAAVIAGLRARGIQMSAPYLSQLRSGKRDNPSTATMVALADFFGIDPAYFTDDEYSAKLDAELGALARLRGGDETESVRPSAGRHRALEPAESHVPVDVGEVSAGAPSESGATVQSATRFDPYPGRLYGRPEAIASATVNRVREEESSAPLTADISLPGSPSTSALGSQGPTVSDPGATMSGSDVQRSRQVEDARAADHSAAPRDNAQNRSLVVDRGRRLFQFLAQVQRLKVPRVTNIDTYRNEGVVQWFSAIPEHDNVSLEFRDIPGGSSDAVLTVERLIAEQPPDIPAALKNWIDGSGSDPTRPPTLRMTIPNDEPGGAGGLRVTLLEDKPEIQLAFDTWRHHWDGWAERIQRDQPVIDLYQTLFLSYLKLSDHPEEFELVLGVGCLGWTPQGASLVKRHLLTSPADITFDASTAALAVGLRPHLENIKVELDMLEPSQITALDHVNSARDDARDSEHHLLDREASGALLRRLVYSLDSAGRYRPEDAEPECGHTPVVSFAPAIILRKRSRLGLLEIFEKIEREITKSGEVPSGLLPLIDPDFEPTAEPTAHDGALVQIEDEVLSPLPLNTVQLQILRAVDSRAQTVVQGPPGTGKTHTAAALLAHLLAQGKRVLVTAHTDQALREVRSKLPDAIKPLAVAVVGSAHSDIADLKVAVERISAESFAHNAGESQIEIDDCFRSIDRLRRERSILRAQMVNARQAEVAQVEFAGYNGTLASIAQKYNDDEQKYGWGTGLLVPKTDEQFPLTADELRRWLALLRDNAIHENEEDAAQRLVDLQNIPDPSKLSDLIDAEAHSSSVAAQFQSVKSHPSFKDVATLPATDRTDLREQMRELARTARELEQRHEEWIAEALKDIRSGRGATWTTRADKIRSMIGAVQPLVDRQSQDTEITVAPDADQGTIESMARHLRDHLAASGPIKTNPDGTPKIGPLTSRVVKNSRPLFDSVRINRRVPTSAEELTAVLDYFEGEQRLAAVDRAWPASVPIPTLNSHWERLQWHVTELGLLSRLLEFASNIQREEKQVVSFGLTPPDWSNTASILQYSELVDAADADEAYLCSSVPLTELAGSLATACAWPDISAVVSALRDAVVARDRHKYAQAYSRLQTLHAVKSQMTDRDTLTTQLRNVAPELTAAVLAEPADAIWDERISQVTGTWNWLRAGTWIRVQRPVDINALQSQVDVIDGQLRQQISRLAALRAWMHAVSPLRLTGRSRADLVQYAQLVRRLGKGTGKYAAQRQADIRAAMIRCRGAVPVWIMPLYRIAEQLDVTQNMFDVIVVDEASQAGLEATFLQYLAPKIVVVGDDKQVSPAAVGIDQQELRDLANMYLRDDPHRASWEDPKQSFFDEAVKRFGSRLTLIEHRRCVPEIIGFSNRIAYEPENIRLQPVRQYGSDRLEPIKTVRVAEGYQRGKTNKINPPEVDAITAQVIQCLSDSRYNGKTMGIISLQGPAQALAIQNALMPKVDPKDWTARELRCGDAPSFQGSERDVVFLSMVAARDEDKRLGASVGTTYVQRYNVASSRAKDQLWLYHSIDIQDVPNSEDMRHQLLDYCYGVIKRGRSDSASASRASLPEDMRVDPFDSLFEQRVYNRLIDRGLHVEPQYEAAGYRIDLVVVGGRYRLAVECDGDAWHGPQEYERDLARQRDLERCGWTFFRIRESEFYIDQHAVLARLWRQIEEMEASAEVEALPSDDGANLPKHIGVIASSEDDEHLLSSTDTAFEEPSHASDDSGGDDGYPSQEPFVPNMPYNADSETTRTTSAGLQASTPLLHRLDDQPAIDDGPENGPVAYRTDTDQSAVLSVDSDDETVRSPDAAGGWAAAAREDGVVAEHSSDNTDDCRGAAAAFYIEAPTSPLGSRAELDHPEWHSVRKRLQDAVHEAIEIEGPIALNRLTRNVVHRFGLNRAKAGRQEIVRQLVPPELIYRYEFGEFVWPRRLDRSAWRGFRRTPPDFFRPLDEIAPEEIINAMAYAARDGVDDFELLMRDTLALFDQKRLTGPAQDRLIWCIDRAEASGRLIRRGAGYVAADCC